MAQWYSLHLGPLGPQKGYGIQTHWCAGESPASTGLDLWVPMACQVVSALVHRRERERERERYANIGSGRKSSRNRWSWVVSNFFELEFLGLGTPVSAFIFQIGPSTHADSWDSKKTQLQVLVSKLSQTREYISVLLFCWFEILQ